MNAQLLGALTILLAVHVILPAHAQQSPETGGPPPAETLDMATVIAMLKQQQKELAEQRAQLNAQATMINSLTQELDALRQSPVSDTAQATVSKPGDTQPLDISKPAAPTIGESSVAAAGKVINTDEKDLVQERKAVAQAQVDDPTQELLNRFPGAWRLPGTDSALSVGGQVRATAVLNRDVLDIPDRFIVGSIPVDQSDIKENAAQSSITANQSRLNFDFREPTDVGILRAFIEGDFAEDGNTFRLRHAFGQWDRILAGQTWSAFVDTNSTPEGVDFEGLNGRINVRQSQVRFSPQLGEDIKLQLSLEDPNPQLQNGKGITRVPDLVLAGSLQPHDRLHLRVALLGRQIRGQEILNNNALTDGGIDKRYAWGFSISGSVTTPRLHSRDKFLFQLNQGDGIGRYVNDLSSIGNYDGIFDERTGKLQLFKVIAGYGSLQHWWGDTTMRSNFTLGYVDINNPGFVSGDAYKRTIRASVNLIWNPTKRVDTGIEYLWGSRENKDGDKGDAQQLQMMVRYIF